MNIDINNLDYDEIARIIIETNNGFKNSSSSKVESFSNIDPTQDELLTMSDEIINKLQKTNNQNNDQYIQFFEDAKQKIQENDDVVSTEDEEDKEDSFNFLSNEYFHQESNHDNDLYRNKDARASVLNDETSSQENLNINQTHSIDVAQGSKNPRLINTTDRLVIIDSQYRPNIYPAYDDPNSISSSTNYTLSLTDSLKNVLSITLYSIQIPTTWYIFDTHLGNTIFYIDDNMIEIESGNYSPEELVEELNELVSLYNIEFTYNSKRHKITISSMESSMDSVNIVFYSDDFNADINHTLGWLLGFRPGDDSGSFSIIIDSGDSIEASAALDIYGPKYFVLILDDFNQNHLNSGLVNISNTPTKLDIPDYVSTSDVTFDSAGVSQVSEQNPRKLTSAQQYTANQILENRNTTSNRKQGPNTSDCFAIIPLKINGATGDNLIMQETGRALSQNTRIYFGPVDIIRLGIRLVDDRGNTVNLKFC